MSRCVKKYYESYNLTWEKRDELSAKIRDGDYDVTRITGTEEELQKLMANR